MPRYPIRSRSRPGRAGLYRSVAVVGGAVAPSTDHAVPLADSVVLTDARTQAVGKAVADSLALADALTRVATAARSVDDTVALADARAFVFGKALADSVTLADLASPAKSKTVNVDDSIVLADALTRVMAYARTQQDGLNLADATIDAQGLRLGDPLSLADARAIARGLALADAIVLADQFSRTVAFVRLIADSLALTDDVATQTSGAITRQVNDLLALSDSLQRTLTIARTLSDSVALADALTSLRGRSATINDPVALADEFSRLATYTRAVADSVALTDAIDVEFVPFLKYTFPIGRAPVLTTVGVAANSRPTNGRILEPDDPILEEFEPLYVP